MVSTPSLSISPYATQPPFHLDGGLPDPITAKAANIQLFPTDQIIEDSFIQNTKQGFKTVFSVVPKTIYKGLVGSSDFTFSDVMLLSKIPYYLGGLSLIGAFLASGRGKSRGTQIGAGVVMYYLGIAVANQAIDSIYKCLYGVHLSQEYRRADGQIEKVYISEDFPRFDLIPDKDYDRMQKKMGIPSNIANRKEAVREQLRGIIASSRATKLLLGNVLAAVGAGYLATTTDWDHMLGTPKALKAIWKGARTEPQVWRRLCDSVMELATRLKNSLHTKLYGGPGETHPWLRKAALGLVIITGLFSIFNSLRVLKSKQYKFSPIAPQSNLTNSKQLALLPLPELFERARKPYES